jgi:hypothetical protein
MSKSEFINAFKLSFVSDTEFKVTFEMGQNAKGQKRVNQVLERFENISKFVFQNDEIWVLLIIWDAKGENKKDFLNIGFDKSIATECYNGKIKDALIKKEQFYDKAIANAEIFYLKYNTYLFDKVMPLVYSKAAFELGFQNTASIVAYFISFKNQPILLNLYDDRGMEILSNDKEIISNLEKKFYRYIRKKS